MALALSLCEELGVDRHMALAEMIRSKPDMGAMSIKHLHWEGIAISLVNAFAANDPISSKLCWEKASEIFPNFDKKIMIVNCRSDRVGRSIQIADMCSRLSDLEEIIVIGDGRQSFIKAAIKNGLCRNNLLVPKDKRLQSIMSELTYLRGQKLLLVGIGNVKDIATNLLVFFDDYSK